MSNLTTKNDYKISTKVLYQRLREVLPSIFRVYCSLYKIADPKTKKLKCSFSDLSAKLNHNCFELYYWLTNLNEIKFIRFKQPQDFNEGVEIKILINL